MFALLAFGICWSIRGISGLLGIRPMRDDYKGKSWTESYIHHLGISDLMIGCPWLVLYIWAYYNRIEPFTVMFITVAISIPSIVYTFACDRKYKAMSLKEGQI